MSTELQSPTGLTRTHDAGANRPLVAAAVFAAFTAALHIFGGGASVATPVAESALADEPRLLALSVWHMVSITLVLSVAAFALGASREYAERSRFLVLFVSTLWIGFGVVVPAVVLSDSGTSAFWEFPQPVLLIPVGLLGFWGSK